MVIASGGYVQNGLDSNQGKTMSATGILICHDTSYPFQERTLSFGQAIKIGRSVARARAATDNAIFDCKVLSRNHALLWYDSGKFYLKDTKSSNGTFVNNKRLSPSGEESAACEVCSGDIVQFGVDVVESTKKVTHGCIIAILKLYLPDGKEAKATISQSVAYVNVTLEDLYKLNQYIQEAGRREKALRSKLEYMQQLLEHTKVAANQSWKALIIEDCLLSRLEMLESQVVTYSKNFGDDKLRIELATLLEDKIQYQNATKELIQKKVQEKREIIGKVQILRCLLSETEEETQSLHNVIKNNQNELQELAIKYIKVQQTLEEATEKLSNTKTKLQDLTQQSEREKAVSLKQFEDQKVIEKNLQLQLRNSKIDIVNFYNQIHALRNYMLTLQDITYTTKQSCIIQDYVSPIDAIDIFLKKSNSCMSSSNHDITKDKNIPGNLNYINGDDQLNLLSSLTHDYLKIDFLSKKLDEGSSDCRYILPPSSNKIILKNDTFDLLNAKEFVKQNYFIPECLAALHANILSDIKNENENNDIPDISKSVHNRKESNRSMNFIINFSDNKSGEVCEDPVNKITKSQTECYSFEHFSSDSFPAHIVTIDQQVNNILEKRGNKSFDQMNRRIGMNTDCIMSSLKPLTNHFVLSKFLQYLVLRSIAQSSNFLDVNQSSENYNTVVQELQVMKNWLLHESNEVIINKLKIYYHQFESEFQNLQEICEQLVIFKEKYNTRMEGSASKNEVLGNSKVQYKNHSNTTYMVPLYYVAPIIFALVYMLVERIL